MLSKFTNAMIWLSAHTVLVTLCALIIMLIAPFPEKSGQLINPIVYKEIGEIFADIWNEIGAWLIVYILEIIVLMVVGTAFFVALLQLCITVASMLVKKAKLLLGIGIYYTANAFISLISALMFYLTFLSGFDRAAELMEDMSQAQSCIFVAVLLLTVGAAGALFSSIFYMATRSCMERKLNLS